MCVLLRLAHALLISKRVLNYLNGECVPIQLLSVCMYVCMFPCVYGLLPSAEWGQSFSLQQK